MRQLTLDMRSSILDIESAPDRRATATATVIRVQIQPRNSFRRSQQHRQLQLCVPLVVVEGQSYRIKDRDLGRVPGSTTEE